MFNHFILNYELRISSLDFLFKTKVMLLTASAVSFDSLDDLARRLFSWICLRGGSLSALCFILERDDRLLDDPFDELDASSSFFSPPVERALDLFVIGGSEELDESLSDELCFFTILLERVLGDDLLLIGGSEELDDSFSDELCSSLCFFTILFRVLRGDRLLVSSADELLWSFFFAALLDDDRLVIVPFF